MRSITGLCRTMGKWSLRRAGRVILAASVALLMPLAPAAAATVSLPDSAWGQPGQSITVPLSITPIDGIIAVDIDIAYDSAVIDAVSVARTTLTQSFSLTYNVALDGWIYVSLFGTQPVTGGGPALTITFQTTAAGCSFLDITRATLNEGEVPATVDDGAFKVCGTSDLDGDGYTACGGDCSDRFAFIHPGAAELCNGADDDCDGLYDEGGVCPCGTYPRPRTEEHWKRICRGTTLEGAIDPNYPDFVNNYLTFAAVATPANICSILNPASPPAACGQAETRFMALLLNLASGRLCLAQPISASSTAAPTVGVAVSEIDALLANPGRTVADCQLASSIAAEIDEGTAIPGFLTEEIALSVQSPLGSDIVLVWPEPDAAAAGRPTRYRVYRAPAPAPLSWTLRGDTVCHQKFTDWGAQGLTERLDLYLVIGVPW